MSNQTWEIKLKLSVADSWVADGFDAAERLEQIEDLLAELLPYAYGHEFKVKATVTKKPPIEKVKELQGF